MTYDGFNRYCSALAATSYVVQWGGSHVWKVGAKVFAVGGWGEGETPGFTFKTSELNFHFLVGLAGYRPAPYLASRGMLWIQQFEALDSDNSDLEYYLKESHRIVSMGLTKKLQKELGLNQD